MKSTYPDDEVADNNMDVADPLAPPDLVLNSPEQVTLVNALYKALDNNEFCLYYQPVADLQTGQVVSMEALIRWIHPVRGVVPPVEFIPVIEKIALIIPLGYWIIKQVCRDIVHWRAQGIAVPHIAINVSPKQLHDPDFAEKTLEILAGMELDPQLITLEITESVLMDYDSSAVAMLKKLKHKGILISMDDFGTGYSALGYLKHSLFDYVKIDQSFIRDIITNSSDAAISNAIISMAHSLGIKVVAEGVETEEQCDFLSKNMCDLIQGYYLSRPMPPAVAGQFLIDQVVLPERLLRIRKISRTLLLVDDEPGILASLKRLFRRDGYHVLIANSGEEGVEILKNHSVDVIVSDQRMPVMTGVDFLRRAKVICPDAVRIMLSGYTELQYITDAINEGSIYKFLTKPWDDQQLRDRILGAFQFKEMADENRILSLRIQTANHELATANRQLTDILERKNHQINRDEISLNITREVLQNIPVPVLGIDEDGMIAFTNSASELLFGGKNALLGVDVDDVLPCFSQIVANVKEGANFSLGLPNFYYKVNWREMGVSSRSKGKLLIFFEDH